MWNLRLNIYLIIYCDGGIFLDITKRDGSVGDFDGEKIFEAIMKAMKLGSGIVKPGIAREITDEITNYSSTLNMKRFSLKFIVSQYENYSLNELKQSDCVLIFFDSTDNNSFAKAKEFSLKIISDAGNIPICLVANKIDLKRRNYNDKEAKELCSKNKIEIFEISVKDNTGI